MRFSNSIRGRRWGVVQRRGVVKIEPNEPCPCGSGVKYKRCCGAATGLGGWWRRRRARQAKLRALAS